MKTPLPYAAFGLALCAATSVQAQSIVTQPVVTVPAGTAVSQPAAPAIKTTETVRTVRTLPAHRPQQVVTTRTITREFVPAPMVVARTVTTTPQPLYDETTPAPIDANPDYSGLYDMAPAAAPAVPDASVTMPVAAVSPAPVVASPAYNPTFYRYVYEPDRILVIDPNTNIAVQALPR
jgi:hypothetical protein